MVPPLEVFRFITGKGLLPLLMAAILAVQPIVATAATELSCDEVVKILIETGQNPAISINPAKETVTIRTTRGFCTESIDAWSKRPALTSRSVKKPVPKPEPAIKTVPRVVASPPPVAEKVAPPKIIVLSPEPKKNAPLPLLQKPDGFLGCQYQLAEVWGSLTIKIEGIEYWLVRAFTMDLDGDRVTDNINFLFKAKNDKNREIQYFGVAGELSGRSYPALKLRNDSVIGRLCFGQETYDKPDFFGEKTEPTWIQVDKPDLAAEKDARDKGVVYVSPLKKRQAKTKNREEGTDWLLWLGVFLVLAIVLGGGYWRFNVRKKGKKGDGEDDGEDDEEGKEEDEATEDDDDDASGAKKKKGLAGLFARFKKKNKKKADDDGDEEENEDG